MDYADDSLWQERRLEEILFSNLDPVTKVRQIVGLGFDEDDAEEVVRRYQIGQHAPVYYERLEFEEEETPDR